MILEGGTYPVPMSLLLLAAVTAWRTPRANPRWRPVAILALTCAAGALLAAPKLLPMLRELWLNPRPDHGLDDVLGLRDLVAMFLTRRTGTWSVAGDGPAGYPWWGEYGAWLGPVVAGLALSAVVRGGARPRPWLLAAGGFLLLTLGDHGSWAPFDLLGRLPFFESLRAPSRFAFPVVLTLAVAAALHLDALGDRLTERAASLRPHVRRALLCLPWLAAAWVAADMTHYGHAVLRDVGHRPVRAVQRSEVYEMTAEWDGSVASHVRRNRGSLACYEPLLPDYPGSRAVGELLQLPGQVSVVPPTAGEARLVAWSPNAFSAEVGGEGSRLLRIRARYDPRWITNGPAPIDAAGTLAVPVPPEVTTVHLRWDRTPLVVGLILGLGGWLGLIGVFVLRRRRLPSISIGPRADRMLLVLVGLLYLYSFPHFLGLNSPTENSRVYMSRALAIHGSFSLDPVLLEGYPGNADLAIRDGHAYSCKAPGASLLGAPILAAWSAVTDLSRKAEVYVLRLFASILPSLAFLAVFLAFLRRFGGDGPRRLVLLALAAGSMFFTYGLLFAGHQQAALGLATGFIVFYVNARERDADSPGLLLSGGAALAFAVSCEYQTALSAVAIGIYGLVGIRRIRSLLYLIAGAALPILLTLLVHERCFGGPFATGHDYLVNQAFRDYQAHGYKGFFHYTWETVWGLTFSPRRGLFFYAPWLLLAPPGLWVMCRDPRWRREGIALSAAAGLLMVFVAGMFAWEGGWSVGPRYLAAVVPLLSIPVVVLLERLWDRPWVPWVVTPLVMTSCVVYATASTVFPHLPDDLHNPLFELLGALLVEGHVPHNLGRGLGLGAAGSMVLFYGILVGAIGVATVGVGRGTVQGRTMRAAGIVLLTAILLGLMSTPRTADRGRVNRRLDQVRRVWEPAGDPPRAPRRPDPPLPPAGPGTGGG